MGHTPNRVDRLLIRTATAARAGMATTADISTGVHPANGRGKRICGSRCHHQHQPWSTPPTDQPILTAHMCCDVRGSLPQPDGAVSLPDRSVCRCSTHRGIRWVHVLLRQLDPSLDWTPERSRPGWSSFRVRRVLTEIPQRICAEMDGWWLRDGAFEAYLSLSRPGALSDLPGVSGRP